MKTEWDYGHLAKAYLQRPDYSDEAVDKMLERAQIKSGDAVCDVGAGVAHLTLKLAARGLSVAAVEPNDNMRQLGSERTRDLQNVTWYEGTGEETGMPDDTYSMVTYGSSFNVLDRERSLVEAFRILKAGGWVAATWNHRKLDDPVQSRIEDIIKSHIPGYDYGVRREDQSETIRESGLFEEPIKIERDIKHSQMIADVVTAWRSHATLNRQAGDAFVTIIEHIENMLLELGQDSLEIPYTTRVWLAQSRTSI